MMRLDVILELNEMSSVGPSLHLTIICGAYCGVEDAGPIAVRRLSGPEPAAKGGLGKTSES